MRLAPSGPFEQAQIDGGGVRGKQGEVDALSVPGGPERQRRTVVDAVHQVSVSREVEGGAAGDVGTPFVRTSRTGFGSTRQRSTRLIPGRKGLPRLLRANESDQFLTMPKER